MADRLRIAYVLPGFCADEEDPCIPVITTFVKEMNKRAECRIYTAEYPFRPGEYHVHDVTVRCTGNRPDNRLQKLAAWRDLGRAIREDHSAAPFDVIHSFWATMPGYIGTGTARHIGIPSVLSLAGGELAAFPAENYGTQLSFQGRWIVRQALRSATAITAGSERMTELVPERSIPKLRTIPLGLQSSRFQADGIRTGYRLLAVAAMIPIKDYTTLLRAVAIARSTYPELTLTTAGWMEETAEHRRIMSLQKDLHLEHAVHHLGEVHYSKMPGLYASHDLFLHSSRYESQGMAILEALAAGMPVISSDVGITSELPRELVYRFTPGNAEEMATQMVVSLSTETHAGQALARGPDLIRSQFNASDVAERFVELYQETVGRRS